MELEHDFKDGKKMHILLLIRVFVDGLVINKTKIKRKVEGIHTIPSWV